MPRIKPPNQNGRLSGAEATTAGTKSTPDENRRGGVGRKAASTNETMFASGPMCEDSLAEGLSCAEGLRKKKRLPNAFARNSSVRRYIKPNDCSSRGTPEMPGPTVFPYRLFHQRFETAEGPLEWRAGYWELPEGAALGAADDQGAVLLVDGFPAPTRVQLRAMQFKESAGYHGIKGPFSRAACVGKLKFPPRKLPDMHAEIFSLTAGWSGAPAQRFRVQNPSFSFAPADPMGAAPNLDSHKYPAAITPSWLPVFNQEWKAGIRTVFARQMSFLGFF